MDSADLFFLFYTLRGVDAEDLIICDEMAYMDPAVFFEVVLPLVEVDSAVIIGISTPVSDQYNFFDRIIKLSYPGTTDPVFASVKVELACNPCKRRKMVDSCKHKLWALPSWKGTCAHIHHSILSIVDVSGGKCLLVRTGTGKFELVKIIYEGVGREETRQRESLGMSLSDQNLVFDSNFVKYFVEREPMRCVSSVLIPDYIFVTVDPNAGAKGDNHSHMAIVSLAYIADTFVVCIITESPVSYTRLEKSIVIWVTVRWRVHTYHTKVQAHTIHDEAV
jgi:hypothetical protein